MVGVGEFGVGCTTYVGGGRGVAGSCKWMMGVGWSVLKAGDDGGMQGVGLDDEGEAD